MERATRCSGLLYLGLDLVVAGRLAKTYRQIDDGDVGDWYTEGHAGKLAVQSGNDLAYGLGGTSGGRDDVLGGTTSITPQLGELKFNYNPCSTKAWKIDIAPNHTEFSIFVIELSGNITILYRSIRNTVIIL